MGKSSSSVSNAAVFKSTRHVEPKIRMEVLSRKGVYVVLASTYLSLAIALVLMVVEYQSFFYDTKAFGDSKCLLGQVEFCTTNTSEPLPLNASDFTGTPTHVAGALPRLYANASNDTAVVSAVWQGSLQNMTFLNEFFALQATVAHVEAQNTSSYTNIAAQVIVIGYAADGNATVVEDGMHAVTVYCEAGSLLCRASLWQQDSLTFTHYHLVVAYNATSLRDGGPAANVTYKFLFPTATYGAMKLSFSTACLAVAAVMLVVWARAMWRVPYRAQLPEQRWVWVLLCCLLLFENPVVFPKLLFGGAWRLVSLMTHFTSLNCFLLYWLVLFDGVRRFRRGFAFYWPKFVFCGVLNILSCSAFVLAPVPADPILENGQFIPNPKNRSIVEFGWDMPVQYLVAAICLYSYFLLVAVYAVWMLVVLVRTRRVLAGFPYLSTRYRQLSFRFMAIQVVMVILFVLTLLVYRSIAPSNILDEVDYVPFGEAFLFSVYCVLTAFIYSPPPTPKPVNLSLPRVSRSRSDTDSSVKRPLLSDMTGAVLDAGDFVAHQANAFVDATLSGAVRLLVGDATTAPSALEERAFCLKTCVWLLNVAWQAYYDPPESPTSESSFGKIDMEQLQKAGFDVVNFISDDTTDTHVLVARETDRVFHASSECDRWHGTLPLRRVVLAFRGTASMTNLSTDLHFSRKDLTLQPEHHGYWAMHNALHFVFALKVHSGFWRAYSAVKEQLMEVVTQMAQKEDLHIYCTGHSLGGALAVLAAFELSATISGLNAQFNRTSQLTMYNFGAPRVGNRTFAQYYDANVPHSHRIVYDADIITTLPKLFGLYKHVGQEIVLDAAGNVIVDPTFVEKVFRRYTGSIGDHRMELYVRGVERALEVTEQEQDMVSSSGSR